MHRRRTSALLAVVAAALVLASAHPARAAGLLDPLLRFRQLRTAHFVIYFHQGEDRLASRLAALVESARTQVGSALGIEPPSLTHVILADQSEEANGWATPLPRNTIFLNAAAPSGAEFIGRTDDWLRLVFTHEYTHIVHLDRSGGWARVARGLLGRNGIAFPNMWLPQWQIEGLATFEESAITGGGRRGAGDFRAIERVAARAGRPLPLDRASGGLVGWPDGHAAYAAGLGFHDYLAGRFGEQSLGALATATARRLPFLGTRAFKSVYGQSLGSLWRDYSAGLRAADAAGAPGARSAVTRLTHTGYLTAGPRFAGASCDGCPASIVYSTQNPDAFPSLRMLEGGSDHQLTRRYRGASVGVSRSVLVFDQQELRRNVGLYSSLFALDRATGHVQAIEHSERLQDPDLAPDGTTIVAMRERGGVRDLVVGRLSLSDGSASIVGTRTLASGEDLQFSTPRWSPDGRLIVVERRRLGAWPDVVVFDMESGAVRGVWADASARIVTPTWRPDGRAIIAAADFDGRPFELYEFDLDGSRVAKPLTSTNGALWPDVSRDGRTIAFAGYSASGFDIFITPYALVGGAPRVLQPANEPSPTAVPALASNAGGYSPLPTLAPTFWTPYVIADSEQTRIGGTVGGADVLGRHAYGLAASWLVRGPTVIRPLDSGMPDWSASYAYTRWRPTPFSSISRQTVFRSIAPTSESPSTSVAGIERELEGGVYLPFVKVRRTSQVLASIVDRRTSYLLAQRDRSIRAVSTRFAIAHDTSQRYGYSISREHGVNAGTTVELTRRELGSRGNATTATVDVRGYAPGLGLHHVLAVRGAAGVSSGDAVARQLFTADNVGASPSVIDFSSGAIGLMRGVLSQSLAGDRLLVGNIEYRIPLAVVERGKGTWPLMLRTIHAAVFADAAEVRSTDSRVKIRAHAFGGELSADAVAGYALPFAATVGVSWGTVAGEFRGAQVYARIGRAF